MARTSIGLLYLGTGGDFPLDVMIRYPRTFIRHVFKVGDPVFDVTNIASVGELNSNALLADLLNPSRAGGQMFSIVEVPGTNDIPNFSGKDPSGMGSAKLLRVTCTALTTGTSDDVQIYTNNSPFKMRIVDAWAFWSTVTASSHVALFDQASGAGVQYTENISSGTAGLARQAGTAVTATGVLPAGSNLFLNRSDRHVAGEVFILVVPEA